MARPVTLYTLQWGDLPLQTVCEKAKAFGIRLARSFGCSSI